jgi:cytochrome c oxidase assembly protein subunit 15
MGCPDWPTCFGKWVPPISVSELPADYKVQYAAYRDRKNQKFGRYLTFIGLGKTARKIQDNKSILEEADFNATKTWVEYVNRLVGVIIGLLIIGLFVVSWKTRKASPLLFRASLILLGLVIFQGWFGSIVVSTNLTSWTVTVHMFLAIIMVAILVWLLVRSGRPQIVRGNNIKPWLLISLGVLAVQLFLGTQVRETLDRLASAVSREDWIENAGMDFIIHRSFSWIVLVLQVVVWLKLRKTTAEKSLTLPPLLLILGSVLTGTGMAWFAVPPLLQPIHLLLAVVSFGWLYQVFLLTNSPPISN